MVALRSPAKTLGEPTIVGVDPKTMSSALSPDATELTLLFDDLRIALHGTGNPLRKEVVVVVTVPVKHALEGKRPRLSAYVRGFLHRTGSAAAAVELRLGHSRRSAATRGAKDDSERLYTTNISLRMREIGGGTTEGVRFAIRLVVKRKTVDDFAAVGIDSIDLSINRRDGAPF